MRTTLLSLSLLLTLTSCDIFGPSDEFSHAAAWFTCGPADGPVTAIALAREPVQLHTASYPFVEIMIFRSVGEIAGKTWNLTSDSATASYVTRTRREPISIGTVAITSVDSAKTVRGALAARFGPHTVTKDFTAPWLENLILCP
jgi:hypothetical protein